MTKFYQNSEATIVRVRMMCDVLKKKNFRKRTRTFQNYYRHPLLTAPENPPSPGAREWRAASCRTSSKLRKGDSSSVIDTVATSSRARSPLPPRCPRTQATEEELGASMNA